MRARRTGASPDTHLEAPPATRKLSSAPPASASRAVATPLATAALLGAAALFVTPLTACNKNKPSTNIAIADGEAGLGEAGHIPSDQADRDAVHGPIQKIQVTGSITAVGDMLDAGGKLINMWEPPEPGAPPVDLRSLLDVTLIQQGFGPGFFTSINLDGVHAAQVGFPHEGQPGVTDRDVDVALSLAASDPVRAIESMPAAMQPQPLGNGIWQIVEDDMELLFRAGQGALEIGLNMESLDLARSLPAKVTVGPSEPRIKLTATNIPSVDIDVTELIPLPPELAKTLSSIINETKSVDFAADFGTDRDLIIRAGARAPFGRLGLDPIGPATQQPSALAKALPGEAMFTWVMPWGDPKLLHRVLDKQIPVNQIPAPFNGYVDEVLAGAHGLLDSIKGEVLATAYIEKGKFTLVLAAEVKDEAAARKSIRGMFSAADKAFQDHIALTGTTPDHKYTVTFKQDAVQLGKGQGDLFTLTVPKNEHDDVRSLGWFLGDKKPQLEVSMVVADGKLIVAIGAGQKTTMGTIGRRLGKTPDAGLEAGGGLALARKLAGGCQYCIALDPIEIGEMVFTVMASDKSEPAEVHTAASKAVNALGRLALDGELAFALRLDDDEGVAGFGWPKALLFANPDEIKQIVALLESIDEARQKAWSAELPPGASTERPN
jgi:hypothetical protein